MGFGFGDGCSLPPLTAKASSDVLVNEKSAEEEPCLSNNQIIEALMGFSSQSRATRSKITPKQVKIESSSSSESVVATDASLPRKVEPPLPRGRDPSSQGTSRKSEEQMMVDPRLRELEIKVEEPQNNSLPLAQGIMPQTSRYGLHAYVKRCNDMIAFLVAATLAFLPIRYLIDAQKGSGVRFHLADFLEVLVKFFEEFDLSSVDPFIGCALMYAAFYILASSSLPPYVVRFAEALAIVFGFGIVFLVIFYISPSTCYVGLASFGLAIGAFTIREFILAGRCI